jgi:hypothetical protein
MVSFPFTDVKIEYTQSNCYFLYPYAFHLNSSTKKYEKFGLKTDINLGGIGLYVYSFDDCTLRISGSNKFQPSEIELKAGLNHIGIPYCGINLENISDCGDIKIIYYNSSDKKWYTWILGRDKVSLPSGISVFIHVNKDCKLSFGTPVGCENVLSTTPKTPTIKECNSGYVCVDREDNSTCSNVWYQQENSCNSLGWTICCKPKS